MKNQINHLMYEYIHRINSNNNYMNYKLLYLKYKTKYLNLKNQIGGLGGDKLELTPRQIYETFIKSNKITADEFVELYDKIQDKNIRNKIINEIKQNPDIDINMLKTKLNIK
jgi:hypothetical protein